MRTHTAFPEPDASVSSLRNRYILDLAVGFCATKIKGCEKGRRWVDRAKRAGKTSFSYFLGKGRKKDGDSAVNN